MLILLAAPVSADEESAAVPKLKLPSLLQPEEQEEAQEEQEQEDSRSFGLPGWWGYEKTQKSTSGAFIPFYYRYKDNEYSISHFWPFYGRKTKKHQYDTHYSLWPFLRHTTYENGTTQVDFPWPFAQIRAGARRFHMHLFPVLSVNILEDNKGSVTLFPFFFHAVGDSGKRTVFFPVYWDMEFPEGKLWHLWPVYGYSKAPGWHRVLLGFPLFRHTRRWDPKTPMRDQPVDRQIDLLWPFIKLRLGPLNKQFHIFPFYYGKTYYRDKEDGKTKLDKRYCYLPPAFWYYSDLDETHFHIWPFGISRTRDGDEKKYQIAFPLLEIHTIKKTKVLEISIPAFLALFKYESRPAVVKFRTHSTRGRSVALRIYPVFSYRSNPMITHLSVNPLFTYNRQLSRDEDIYTRLSVVGGIVFLKQRFREKMAWHFLLGTASYKSDVDGYDFRILYGLFGLGRKDKDKYLRLFWIKF